MINGFALRQPLPAKIITAGTTNCRVFRSHFSTSTYYGHPP